MAAGKSTFEEVSEIQKHAEDQKYFEKIFME